MNNSIFEITLKNDKRIIPELADFMAKAAVKLGLSKQKANFLCFTIETVLDYRIDAIDDINKEIKVVVTDDGKQFKFTVIDLGAPYVLTKNQQAFLNKKLVDKYQFEQLGRKGQRFSFSYKYDAITRALNLPKSDEKLLDEEFDFRRVVNSDEDVLKAVTCLYDTYGYDYYHQHLYSVEGFRKYMNNGRYVPIIAENKHGQAMCYCALDENEWFLGVPEFSNLVTKPLARGKGLASKIFVESEKIAQEMNYEGIHVSAVAYHPYTQKMCNKLGYTPSAIEYSLNPKGTGGYDEDRRLDCVIGVKIFNKKRKHDLYIGKECNDMFKMIFDNEHLNYEIHNETIDTDCEDIITYGVDSDTSNCFLKIDECSNNVSQELTTILKKEEVKNCDVVTVNLNMNNPSCIKGYKALRQAGFICVGCIPGCLNGDYMLLQAFKVQPEYEKIVVEDNYRQLVEEVYKLNDIQN